MIIQRGDGGGMVATGGVTTCFYASGAMPK